MKTVLIRAEDKNHWESRTPIVPKDLAQIIERTGARAFVEKSEKRFAGESEYREAGATICDDMTPGDVILGIKEIPVDKILPGKTYSFFSHTIKGQKDNMVLLQKVIDSKATLIDYEKILDSQKRRLIYFGPYAGGAGSIDILSLMGEHWVAKGIKTPLSEIKRAHEYRSLQDALEHVTEIGKKIEDEGFPAALCPFTIGVLGYGNVSKGAQEVLDCLPIQRLEPAELTELSSNGQGKSNTIYLTVFQEKDLVQPCNPEAEFILEEYFNHPDRYESCFEQYLDKCTLLINAVYWDKQYPRFVTWKGLQKMVSPSGKLAGIADISCDVNGAVECTVKSTGSDMPAYLVDPATESIKDGHIGTGIVLLAVDNLPCELPHDSSVFFSKQLAPFISNMLEADYTATLETSSLCPELKEATIVYNGKLTEAFQYLEKHLN